MVSRLDPLVEVKFNKIFAEISPTPPPAVDVSGEKKKNPNQVQQKKIYQINFILDLSADFTVLADVTIAKPEVSPTFILNSNRYRSILEKSIPELRRDLLTSSREFGTGLKLKDLLQKFLNVDFKA